MACGDSRLWFAETGVPNKAELDRHMMVHTVEVNPYVCSVCGWKFRLSLDMDKQLQTQISAHLASPDLFLE